jgi:hypothetical protein
VAQYWNNLKKLHDEVEKHQRTEEERKAKAL